MFIIVVCVLDIVFVMDEVECCFGLDVFILLIKMKKGQVEICVMIDVLCNV